MNGLGITFDDSSSSESSPSPPPSPTPQREPPDGRTARLRSTTDTSDDSFMESKLSQFDSWKKTVTTKVSQKEPAPSIPPSPSTTTTEPFPDVETPSDDPGAIELRATARALAARAAICTVPPDVTRHPAFRRQNVALRRKRVVVVADEPRCWRPELAVLDEEPWPCCERMDTVCEDCGYVLCEVCGSRCRGPDWCVVAGCVRCQTRLGINICTPHLRELRARPERRFHGHRVEEDALDLIEEL